MADGTHIEWTDATWNPITGCSVVSAGCKHCYAMKLAGTRLKHDPSRAGLTIDTKAGPVWNGQVRFNEQWLDQPLRWRRPRRIFVCAHGDLFHENVPDAWIDKVFMVMRCAPTHTFQVLTKRPERMRAYLSRFQPSPAWDGYITRDGVRTGDLGDDEPIFLPKEWPLPNVWLGVSVEDQATANERIPLLLTTPAAVRWISAEPLLGPIDLTNVWPDNTATMDAFTGDACHVLGARNKAAGLDWIVAGGESGQSSRPMHPEWPRALRDQCAAAGTPFLFKQWGDWLPCVVENEGDGVRVYPIDDAMDDGRFEGMKAPVCIAAGHEFWRVGKKLAGRQLDGVQHDGYPEARHA